MATVTCEAKGPKFLTVRSTAFAAAESNETHKATTEAFESKPDEAGLYLQ